MLAWELEWGPHVEALERVARTTRGRIVPKALQTRPKLHDDLRKHWYGLSLLRSRINPETPNERSQLSEIRTWAEIQFPYAGPEDLRSAIELMAWLDDKFVQLTTNTGKKPSAPDGK